MSSNISFSAQTISHMNATSLWNHTIMNEPETSNSKTLYNLHSTGYADLSGRKYVALPSNLKITSEIKKQYNLWP